MASSGGLESRLSLSGGSGASGGVDRRAAGGIMGVEEVVSTGH